ncbi:MAG: hypothetical protein ACQESR_06035 [Planctomycetota bacterium]
MHDFLRQADLVKFAGVHAGEQEIRKSTDVAMRFLDDTRAEASLIDAPEGLAKEAASARAATVPRVGMRFRPVRYLVNSMGMGGWPGRFVARLSHRTRASWLFSDRRWVIEARGWRGNAGK